jgi:hypothetical protein
MVVHAEDDFGRAIEAALDIRINFFMLKAAATEVNDLDSAFCRMSQQNVLTQIS